MFFTQEDYKKIQSWLQSNAVKDTEFNEASIPFEGKEIVTLIQGGHNVRVHLSDLINQLFLLGIPDFINITDRYNKTHISLSEAIEMIPIRNRRIGQVITFIDEEGKWQLYQFQGASKYQWNSLSLWIDLIAEIAIRTNIVPDEEDVTGVKRGDATVIKLKDKRYDPEEYSGLGRVYLRKNVITVNSEEGDKELNILTQNMISLENTRYIIQYDYDLNGQTITIPKGCILDFQGGSLSNGRINFNGCFIKSPVYHIFKNITISSGVVKNIYQYAEWYGAKADDETDCINAFETASKVLCQIRLLTGTYRISRTWKLDRYINVRGMKCKWQASTIVPTQNFSDKALIILTLADSIFSDGYFGHLHIRGVIDGTQGYTVGNFIGIVTSSFQERSTLEYVEISRCDIGLFCTACWNFNPRTIKSTYNNYGIWLSTKVPNEASIYKGGVDYSDLDIRYDPINGIDFYQCNIGSYIYGGVYEQGYNTAISFSSCNFETKRTEPRIPDFAFYADNHNATLNLTNCYWEVNHPAITINKDQTYRIGALNIFGGFIDINTVTDSPIQIGKTYSVNVLNLDLRNYAGINYDFTITTDAKYTNIFGALTGGNKGNLQPVSTDCEATILGSATNWNTAYGGLNNLGTFRSKGLAATCRRVGGDSCDAYWAFGFNGIGDVNEGEIANINLRHNYPDSSISLHSAYYWAPGVNVDTELLRFGIDYVQAPKKFQLQLLDESDGIAENEGFANNAIALYRFNKGGFEFTKLIIGNQTKGKWVDAKGYTNVNANYFGTTANRPELSNTDLGFMYYDTDIVKVIFWSGNKWIDIYGNNADSKLAGPSNLRPSDIYSGYSYFDTTINKPIWWTGEKWVDAEGNDADSTPITSGTFANKPTGVDVGYAYFCTDKQTTEGSSNGIMIYYKGSNTWVDALGRTVQ